MEDLGTTIDPEVPSEKGSHHQEQRLTAYRDWKPVMPTAEQFHRFPPVTAGKVEVIE